MKAIKYIFVGLGFGFIVTTICSIAFNGINPITAQLLAWLIASALYGLSALVFDSKKLSLPTSTVIHFIICLGVTLVNVYLFYRQAIISVIVVFVIVYIIIYFVQWVIAKNDIKKLNEKLNKR